MWTMWHLLKKESPSYFCIPFWGAYSIFYFLLFRAGGMAYGSSQAMGQIGASAASLGQSHSNAGSDSYLQPTSQLTATPDPYPTDQGQGLNLDLMILVGFVNRWATMGIPQIYVSMKNLRKYQLFLSLGYVTIGFYSLCFKKIVWKFGSEYMLLL